MKKSDTVCLSFHIVANANLLIPRDNAPPSQLMRRTRLTMGEIRMDPWGVSYELSPRNGCVVKIGGGWGGWGGGGGGGGGGVRVVGVKGGGGWG